MSVHVYRYIFQLFLIFLKIYLWICLFLAMLGLRCCVVLSLAAESRGWVGYPLAAVLGFLIVGGFSCCRVRVLGHGGFSSCGSGA